MALASGCINKLTRVIFCFTFKDVDSHQRVRQERGCHDAYSPDRNDNDSPTGKCDFDDVHYTLYTVVSGNGAVNSRQYKLET